MQQNLYNAYCVYYQKKSAISFKAIEYFDAISYIVLQEDDANIDIKIRVGDAIDIEEDNGLESRAYVIIRGIFTHMANNEKSMLFYFRLVL